jgi:hypothetical protein
MAAAEPRQPRFEVFLGGVLMPNVTAITVAQDDSYTAGRFSISVADPGAGLPAWMAGSTLVEISVQLDGQGANLISGYVDEVAFDPVSGCLEVSGRDLASLPLTTLRAGNYENQSGAEIASTIAAQYGLTAAIDGSTGLYGRYYQTNTSKSIFAQYNKFQSDWDILTAVARSAACGLWVDGRTLNIAPIQSGLPQTTIVPTDCHAINLSQQLDLAAGITVTVKSWDSATESAVSGSAQTGSGGTTARTLDLTVTNARSGDVNVIANYLLGELNNHTTTISLDMPGELSLTPRAAFLLQGTSTDFDGLYLVRSLERRISFDHGFTQALQGYQVQWTP